MKLLDLLSLYVFVPCVVAWTFPGPSTREVPRVRGNDVVVTSRRDAILQLGGVTGLFLLATPESASAIPTIDVNNALAREFTAFPGLYPTVATKIVNAAKDQPFKSKKDVYAVLNELEAERLRQYDKSIVIVNPDKSLQQFKTSQICKYECGGRTSNEYRDAQIRAVQAARAQ